MGAALLIAGLVVAFALWPRAAPLQPGAIVAFGDSYTAGTGAQRHQAFPALLEGALGRPVVNAGRLGETAAEAYPRLKRDVLRHDPRLVIVEFGVNEAFRGDPVSAAAQGLERILTTLDAEGIPVVLVGVHFGPYQADNFDPALADLARRFHAELVVGALDGVLEDPELRSDPYHPNARGYKVMFDRILPAVQRALHERPAQG